MSKLGRTLCLFCLLVIVILLGEILIKTHNNNLPRQAYVNDSFSLENDFYPNYEAFQVAAQALWKNKAIFYQDGQKHPIIIGNSDAETIYKQNHLEKSISLDDWNTVIILDEIKKYMKYHLSLHYGMEESIHYRIWNLCMLLIRNMCMKATLSIIFKLINQTRIL